MTLPRAITRRSFLKYSAFSTAGGYLLWTLGACRREARTRAPAPVFLTVSEMETASAACERILPRDQDPGAIDLGVPQYIDRMLATEPRQAAQFRAGLRALDEEAKRRTRQSFARAGAVHQDDLIDDWQDGSPEQAGFVALLVQLTLEGAFGDPSYGGNRDGKGWRLVGFEPCEPRAHHHG